MGVCFLYRLDFSISESLFDGHFFGIHSCFFISNHFFYGAFGNQMNFTTIWIYKKHFSSLDFQIFVEGGCKDGRYKIK